MSSEWIIGALALITIGGTAGLAVFHFGFHLKDPNNMAAAKQVATDRESAATAVSSEAVNGRSLRQRLEDAPGINDRLGNRRVGSLGLSDLLDPNLNLSVLKRAVTRGEQTSKALPS